MPEPVTLFWSGGKDSVLAFWALRTMPQYEAARLLATLSARTGSVPIHGVPGALLEAQAEALGLPLTLVTLPDNASNEAYRAGVGEALNILPNDRVAFGDLFLRDVRRWREEACAEWGVQPLFPLWGLETTALARKFVADGFRALVCAVDTQHLDAGLAGHAFDADFLNGLPPEVDPCGERGEFHTFVFDGPPFRHAVHWQSAEHTTEGRHARQYIEPA